VPPVSQHTSPGFNSYFEILLLYFRLAGLGGLKRLASDPDLALHQSGLEPLEALWVLALCANLGEHSMYYLPALSSRCQS
jgi:hypothetical protein